LYEDVKNDLIWLKIPYGKVLIFSPNFLHGNIVNTETTTRWSCNVRFTGLFTPYTSPDKSLGSFYLPINTKPVTKLGLDYKKPSGFKE
jgi:sporadic carbohydrate cluster 2OG-Fe(II) oxygenase